MSTPRIVSVDLKALTATTSEGKTVPVTNRLDALGEQILDWNDCVAFVAGEGTEWFMELLEDFDVHTRH